MDPEEQAKQGFPLRIVRGHTLRELSKADLEALHAQLAAELPSGDLDVLHNSAHAAQVSELDWVEAELWGRE